MKKKILYMLNYTGKGGTEKYVLDLMKTIGPENCILVYSEEGPGLDLFKAAEIKTFQVNMNHPFDFKAANEVKRIADEQAIDVIHAQFLRENYIAILAKILGAKVNVIWTYHVDVPMNIIIRNVNKVMTRYNRRVIAVSKFMMKQLEAKGIPKDKLRLIYNGVAEQQARPCENVKPIITVIGRLREEKGQAFLIRSLRVLAEKSPQIDWGCHIYGEGPDKEGLNSLIKELGLNDRVILKGFSDDKVEMYGCSDIIVVPSRNEALSYVAIEALAFGKAVISTNVGGLPEVVRDKETGLLVEYDDVEGLAEKLKELLTNDSLRADLSMNGRKHFNENFSFESMVGETVRQYNL